MTMFWLLLRCLSRLGSLILRWTRLLPLRIESIVVISASVAHACYEGVMMLQSVGAFDLLFHWRFELFSQFRIGIVVSARPNTFWRV